MAAASKDKAAILATLPMRADEDPFVVGIGGFYRRWFNLIDDLQLLSRSSHGRRRSTRSPRGPTSMATAWARSVLARGGLWVMRLAAHDPRVKALISCAPGGVGYWGTPEERAEWRRAAEERAKTNWFGPRGTRPPAHKITEEEQRQEFLRWSLKDNDLLKNLTMPMYLVNGKIDHLTPIGNLYLLLESGPPTGRVARVYPEDGHIAAKNEREWGPAAWRWLREQLTK